MIGKKLSNRYEITGELGRGGMGVVYRALDPLLDREVAVKLIPPTMLNPDTEQRFQHEAKLVAQIRSSGNRIHIRLRLRRGLTFLRHAHRQRQHTDFPAP